MMAPFKFKVPTTAQVQKEDAKARTQKRAEVNKRLNLERADEQMKVTHYTKDQRTCRHGGDPCPHSSKTFKRLTLMHTNGITDILVNFCFCSEHLDDFEQLLDLRLFPATVKRVETVFSFELLDEFHLHTLTNKKAVFDYYDALQHKTNLVLPQNAPNCYQLLIRVSHLHHHLAGKRRSGQSHGIDQYAPHRPENRTAVYCPACPEPNFNIDVQEIQNTPPEKR
ncbi:hypothetical protein Moror_11304 [Moniliophthora roreri MCA 2997]|uniref:CxC2-like cysteine cluster KDZ transposase-associated domain-containing protein n=1 Tax=Moniliophthora roreri (strain MCA 2997) TaxID=1381753 RepID=V2XVX9_MONRO|nr:hypothetical protein Moror_11304 [Moniliophthora roreri MCA 2997]